MINSAAWLDRSADNAPVCYDDAIASLVLAGGQAGADQLLVVAGEDVPVGEGRMRPADAAALRRVARVVGSISFARLISS